MSTALATMASRFEMEPAQFEQTLRSTVVPAQCSNEQFATFLMVANEYNLNPLTKEIYAFPSRGGIQPIVSIDGWMRIINRQPEFDGMEFKDTLDQNGNIISITCKIYNKGRTKPTEVTEYMNECTRNTDTWKQWPNRMLRHKAAIQCARYAFGFSGIMDEDEYQRMQSVTEKKQERAEKEVAGKVELEPYPQDRFEENFPKWKGVIESGKRDAEFVISKASEQGILSEDQISKIKSLEG